MNHVVLIGRLTKDPELRYCLLYTSDKTFIQSRMLNTAKGPAVHSLRAQADKFKYHTEMKKTLENEPNLEIVMDEVVDLINDGKVIKGVITRMGCKYHSKAVVLATGVYLNSLIYIGEVTLNEGPNGCLLYTSIFCHEHE